ncbi:hypothetical protein [Flavobacterium agrisoli]|uniref:hypothetical protein n=1 Tax=Flavobacterium agrisoli TaxID=2793066 RepID=UPI001F1BDB69|nr:hypothetical protein [Flavobacterium agrisoli]
MKKFFWITALLFCLTSCSDTNKPQVAFYYWKTSFYLSQTEKQILKANEVQKIYIRYFDVDLHPITEEAYPRTPIYFVQKPTVKTIVPVVYLKNKVLLSAKVSVPDLVEKVLKMIQEMNTANQLSCEEIQIDCDWTIQSRDKFMAFIEAIKQKSKKKISGTIRLHQIKYAEQTKVPPVNSAVLMYYNMGTIAVQSLNSIYDRSIAQKYLKSVANYPLPLKVALPIYAWGIHIRENRILGLRSKLTIEDLQLDHHFSMISDTQFEVNESNFRTGVFYRKGDVVKIEAITTRDLKEMADDLSDNLSDTPEEIIFYDLDEANFKNYETTVYKEISNRF